MRGGSYILESLANYYYRTGDFDLANAKYQEIISNKNSLGWETQEYWFQAHYIFGKIYEETGNNKQAISYYQEFLNIWENADEELPELMDAKSRLMELREMEP